MRILPSERVREAARAILASLLEHKAILAGAIATSVLHGVSSIVGLTALVPVISMLTGQPLVDLAGVPILATVQALLPDDREVVFFTMLAVIVSLGIAKALLQLANTLVAAVAKNRIMAHWQHRVLRHWLGAPYESHDAAGTGLIMHLVNSEIVQMGSAAQATVHMVSAAIQAGIAFVFLAAVSPVALLLLCAMTLLLVLPVAYVTRLAFDASKDATFSSGLMIRGAHHLVKRVELIDIFGQKERELSTMLGIYRRYLRAYVSVYFTRGLSPLCVQITVSLVIVSLFTFFFYRGAGEGTLATLILFIGGIVITHPQLERISGSLAVLARSVTAYEAIRGVLDLPERPPEVHRAIREVPGAPAFDVKDVSFSYQTDGGPLAVLDGASATIAPGGLHMIFGPTGAGKTTLLRLLQGLQAPASGAIACHGVALSEIPKVDIARFALMMPQDKLVFTGTIRENLAYGLEDVDERRLEAALRRSSAAEFVDRLADGLEFFVGEDGSRLSGGQRQRLALARVIAARPRVMLLDEPTSALDRDTEHAVLDALLELADDGTTVVMSTHKVELAPFADSIVWFEGGQLRSGVYDDFHASLRTLVPSERMRRGLAAGRA